MYTMKSKRNSALFVLCFSLAFFISSCEKNESCGKDDHQNSNPPASSSSSSTSRVSPTRNQMQICHYDAATNSWSLLTIKNNQLGFHLSHGDVRVDDPDGDGYTARNACGVTGRLGTNDCNDDIGWIYPGAPEICNNDFDENCNGDEDDPCPN